jgi:hypothetical protein
VLAFTLGADLNPASPLRPSSPSHSSTVLRLTLLFDPLSILRIQKPHNLGLQQWQQLQRDLLIAASVSTPKTKMTAATRSARRDNVPTRSTTSHLRRSQRKTRRRDVTVVGCEHSLLPYHYLELTGSDTDIHPASRESATSKKARRIPAGCAPMRELLHVCSMTTPKTTSE